MSDIQRWIADADVGIVRRLDNGNYEFLPHNTEVVLYDDHLAAVAAARAESYADGRVDGMRDVADLCYQRGFAAAVGKCRDAVGALPTQPITAIDDAGHAFTFPVASYDEALAAIDAPLEAIQAAADQMSEPEFRRAYLNQWVTWAADDSGAS